MLRSLACLVVSVVCASCVDDPALSVADLSGIDLRSGSDLPTLDRDLLPVGSEDCLNGVDDNDDGLVDCADPLCSDFECVADSGPAPIGVLVGALDACPDGYTREQPLRRGVVATGCSGCGCEVRTDCAYKVQLFSDTTCSTVLAPVYFPQTNDYDDLNDNCLFATTPARSIASVKVTLDQFIQSQCYGTGTPTLGPLDWNVDLVFCRAHVGGGCTGGARCVQRRNEALCSLRNAQDTCDGAYATDLDLHYQNVDDQRACRPCTAACALTVPGMCSTGYLPGDLVANSGAFCAEDASPKVGTVYDSTMLGVCTAVTLTAVEAMHFNIARHSFGGACTVNTLADGSATPTEPTRVCCH